MKQLVIGGRLTRGFTLVELMIVVAVVAILAAIGYPSYQSHVRKTYRSDAKNILLEAAARQEEYFLDNRTYTTDLANLGYTTNSDGTVDTEHGAYKLSVSAAGATSYSLLATAQGDQANDDCGNLTLNNLGVKGVSGAGTSCW